MITTLIAQINSFLTDVSPDENLQVFGLAKLMLKSAQVHPVADLNNQQIAINDVYNGIVYHRILSPSQVAEREDFMFGNSIPRELTVKVRTVVAYKKALTRDFIYELANRIPETFDVVGYKYVDIDVITINEDDDAIYEQEFGAGDYEKRREPWIIRALEYDTKFIIC